MALAAHVDIAKAKRLITELLPSRVSHSHIALGATGKWETKTTTQSVEEFIAPPDTIPTDSRAVLVRSLKTVRDESPHTLSAKLQDRAFRQTLNHAVAEMQDGAHSAASGLEELARKGPVMDFSAATMKNEKAAADSGRLALYTRLGGKFNEVLHDLGIEPISHAEFLKRRNAKGPDIAAS